MRRNRVLTMPNGSDIPERLGVRAEREFHGQRSDDAFGLPC